MMHIPSGVLVSLFASKKQWPYEITIPWCTFPPFQLYNYLTDLYKNWYKSYVTEG
jgi:hypothetical protein